METEDNNQCVYLIEQYLLKNYTVLLERFARMNAVVQSINNEQQDITELSVCLSRI